MKKIMTVFLLLTSNVFAAELNLRGGETAVIQANVNTRVTCGGDGAGASCEENCQKFSSYDSDLCVYRIQCAVEGNCVVQTSCEKFSSYDSDKCVSEVKKKSCH